MRLVKAVSCLAWVVGSKQQMHLETHMCWLSGLCPTDVLEMLNLVLLLSLIYFLSASGRYTDFSTL